MNRPKISIVTIARNSVKTIDATMQSVASQHYDNLEYIIIDGKSTDGTLDIVRRYSSLTSLVVSEADEGISDAFNKGIQHANGDLILLLNSDDCLLPGVIDRVADEYCRVVEAQPHAIPDIFCGNVLMWNPETDFRCREVPSIHFPVMPFFVHVAHQGMFATKRCYERFGTYDVQVRHPMDLDFLMRVSKGGGLFHRMDIDVAEFRIGGTTNQWPISKKKKDYLYIVKKNGGNMLQAYCFYYFLWAIQNFKSLFGKRSHDFLQRLRYGSVNKTLSVLIVLITMIFHASPAAADFPLIADAFHTRFVNLNDFKVMKEAGFNAFFAHYETLDDMEAGLSNADKENLKVILFSNLFQSAPQRYVVAASAHHSLWKYYLADEPKMTDYARIRKMRDTILRYHQLASFYVNLFPNANKEVLLRIGAKSYPEYLQHFSRLRLPQLSYDFYPVVKGDEVAQQWYSILEDVRRESIRTSVPFWAYVLCVPHICYPKPTLSHLRLQCYVNLAYGAQALQYFAYWTPAPTKEYDFYGGPVLRNGKCGPSYAVVKSINTEMKPMLPFFEGSKVLKVGHLGKIPTGCSKMQTLTNIRKITVTGDEGAVVCEMQNKTHRYAVIVNKSLKGNLDVNIIPHNGANVRHITKSLCSLSLQNTYIVPPGDILLLQLN